MMSTQIFLVTALAFALGQAFNSILAGLSAAAAANAERLVDFLVSGRVSVTSVVVIVLAAVIVNDLVLLVILRRLLAPKDNAHTKHAYTLLKPLPVLTWAADRQAQNLGRVALALVWRAGITLAVAAVRLLPSLGRAFNIAGRVVIVAGRYLLNPVFALLWVTLKTAARGLARWAVPPARRSLRAASPTPSPRALAPAAALVHRHRACPVAVPLALGWLIPQDTAPYPTALVLRHGACPVAVPLTLEWTVTQALVLANLVRILAAAASPAPQFDDADADNGGWFCAEHRDEWDGDDEEDAYTENENEDNDNISTEELIHEALGSICPLLKIVDGEYSCAAKDVAFVMETITMVKCAVAALQEMQKEAAFGTIEELEDTEELAEGGSDAGLLLFDVVHLSRPVGFLTPCAWFEHHQSVPARGSFFHVHFLNVLLANIGDARMRRVGSMLQSSAVAEQEESEQEEQGSSDGSIGSVDSEDTAVNLLESDIGGLAADEDKLALTGCKDDARDYEGPPCDELLTYEEFAIGAPFEPLFERRHVLGREYRRPRSLASLAEHINAKPPPSPRPSFLHLLDRLSTRRESIPSALATEPAT
ncbi:hypothetical protein B0H15DRAFT_1017630 [Mycena belliarum]|uniref:Uncharacterized protein n=1 Tax=Mycena belliarum TaxID=1033014 RepID=A0AAD6UL40_9AGAR|nr:hypothetical protein B0H15DRAFT_1017630 [Mycena belliae]